MPYCSTLSLFLSRSFLFDPDHAQGFDYHMDLGGLGPAHIALQEFNLRKVGIYE